VLLRPTIGKGKGRYSSSWEPQVPKSELRDATCHMGSHSVTCYPTQVNAPRLIPAMQAGTRFIYTGRMEGWVDLVDLIAMIAPRLGVEPATFRSRVRRRTTAPPRQPSWPISYCYDSVICLSVYPSVCGEVYCGAHSLKVATVVFLGWHFLLFTSLGTFAVGCIV